MARHVFRLPKGLPREITRVLRLGRKRPGQFIDYATAFRLRDALRSYYTPTPTAPRKPAKRRKPAPKPRPEPEIVEAEEPEVEEGALEWEVGIKYEASVRTSNVAFNARFYRADGRVMTEDDARGVLRHIVYHGEAPPGVIVQEVYWQRREGGRRRYGRTGEMTAFYDILGKVGDDGMTTTPIRLGAVKRDWL